MGTTSSATGLANDTSNVSQCLVRPSTSADMPYVTAIYTRFVTTSTATFEIVAPDESEMLRRRQAVLDRNLPYLVAELEGYIVGFCYASQFRPREGYRFTVEDSIYIRPDCIGHGAGKALLAHGCLYLWRECSLCRSACIAGISGGRLIAGSGVQIRRMDAPADHAASLTVGMNVRLSGWLQHGCYCSVVHDPQAPPTHIAGRRYR